MGVPDIKKRQTNPNSSHGFHHWADNFDRFSNSHPTPELLLAKRIKMLRFILFTRKRLYHTDSRKALLQDGHHRSHFLFFELPLAPYLFAVVNNRDHTHREQEEADKGEFPVEVNQYSKSTDYRERLLNQVTANTRQGCLSHSGVVRNPRNQVSGTFAIKELKRLFQDMGIKLATNIGQQAQSDPCHVVAVEIVAQTSQDEDEWNNGANEKDGVNTGTGTVHGIAQHIDFVLALRKNLRIHVTQNQGQKSRDQSKKRAKNQRQDEAPEMWS